MQSKLLFAWCAMVIACGTVETGKPGPGSNQGSGSGSDQGSGAGSGSGSDTSGAITLDSSGFVIVGSQWWTANSGPTLHGTIDPAVGTLQAYVGGTPVGMPASIAGTTWSLVLPSGTITEYGTTIDLELSGPGVTPTMLGQLFVLDLGKPAIAFTGGVYDERNDTIDFSSGNAVHTHHGAPITLGVSCPDLYMYAYLMSAEPPPWGGETSANPLAWQVTATSPVGIDTTASQYRVRGSDGAMLLDWTPLPAASGGASTVALHRDGPQGIPTLGTNNVLAYVDVQVEDALGNAATATSCVSYHPLAAPLEIQPIAAETAGEALFGMTFAAASPISDLLQVASSSPSVFGERFLQHTAEPITLAVSFTPPIEQQYEKTVTSVFVEQTSGSLACGTSEAPSSDARCATLTNVTGSSTSSSGALASGIWQVAVIDEATGSLAGICTVDGLTATCSIPPRQSGEAPHAYRLVTTLDDVTDLVPATTGALGQYTVGGRIYTGVAPTTASKCTTRTTTFVNSTAYYTCAYTTFAHVIALAAAELTFDTAAVWVSTSVGPDVAIAPVPYAPTPLVTSSMTWNAGPEVLPGS